MRIAAVRPADRRTEAGVLVLASVMVGILLVALGPAPVLAETCLTQDCHAELTAMAYAHPPVAEAQCLACHTQENPRHPLADGRSFALNADGPELCSPCHSVMTGAKFRHAPAETGDCLGCHRPHGGSHPALLTHPAHELCFTCHDRFGSGQEMVHGPAASGECGFCHLPHESPRKHLLKQETNQLCLACHDEYARQLQAAAVIHQPVKEDPCTSCHLPHASANIYLLRREMPGICFECHQRIDRKLREAGKVHAPVRQEKSCSNCHSTHFSPAPGLLAADEMTLCLSCHGGGTAGTPPLRNMKQELEKKKHLHGPLQDGRCSGCHDPHGADAYRLLSGPYPEGQYFQYRPGAYDFCLQCHQKYLLRFPETTLYTEFRDGRKNLHYVHVVEPRKGRTCRMCHQPHAADGEKLIRREGIPFGDWQIPIRFEATATGGSCAPGCHRPMEYDRNRAEAAKPDGCP